MARQIVVEYSGDASDLQKASKDAAKSVDSVNKSAGDVGETFDKTATKSATVAGAFGDLGGALSEVHGPLGALGSGMQLAAPLIMAVSGAMDLASLASGAWAGAQWLLNAALAAMPIILIAAGIVALITAIVLIATKTTWFQDIWTAAWDVIAGAAKAVFNWVTDNWPLLLAIITGPIGVAVLLITKNFDTIKDAFSSVYTTIKNVVGDIVSFLGGVPAKITAALGGMWNFVSDEFKGVLNTIIGWWNNLHFPSFTLPTVHIPFLGDVGGGTIGGWDLPNIPTLAAGGIVTRPTLALIGEAGPEAVVPLGRGGAGGTIIINNTFNIPETANPAESGRVVASWMRSYFAAGGRLAVPV